MHLVKKLIEKYNLRGKAGKDQARQYGRISKIKDLEKLKSSTVKDGRALLSVVAPRGRCLAMVWAATGAAGGPCASC